MLLHFVILICSDTLISSLIKYELYSADVFIRESSKRVSTQVFVGSIMDADCRSVKYVRMKTRLEYSASFATIGEVKQQVAFVQDQPSAAL